MVELIGQPSQQPHQQIQQPLVPLQQPPQPNLDPMAYAPIVKLEKFTDDARTMQVISYFLKDTANSWYHNLVQKPQNFNAFKLEFLRYFSNNNSINCLASIFTTIKQEDTEAVTTYLRCFHRNLHQIQAIQANYFTAPQILNQFIQRLCSSILQQICPMHLVDLPTAMTHARDFEAAELEANHAQAVNLVINGSSDLDFKLKQFSNNINQKLEGYLADNCETRIISRINHVQDHPLISHNSQKHVSATTVQLMIRKSLSKPRSPVSDSESPIQSRAISKCLPAYDAATNLSANNISTANLSVTATNNLSTIAISHLLAAVSSNLLTPTSSNATPKLSYNDVRKPKIQNHPKLEISDGCSSTDSQFIRPDSGIGSIQNLNSQNYLSLLVISEDITSNNPELNQQPTILTNNILPAIVTNDESLAAIFPFKLKEVTSVPLFSRAALKKKPITVMYTDAKVDGHSIKLILDSVDQAVSARIITVDGATKMPIGEIDNFPIEVNGIITFIKVLVMEATQYQALDDDNNGKEEQGKESICRTTIDA
ncbi:hypothetical protein G9A89_018702 [Geosiphon pyriformis]|nr:hypothetical protein G9A89_018702 [Geosiphon pyriformis]